MNQSQPKPLELTPDELAKVLKRKATAERNKSKVHPEEFIVAEMGYYFGWGAVEAILYDRITLNDAMTLLHGARKVWNGQLLDIASIMYTTNAAAQSGKKAKSIMTKGLKDIIKEAKVDK